MYRIRPVAVTRFTACLRVGSARVCTRWYGSQETFARPSGRTGWAQEIELAIPKPPVAEPRGPTVATLDPRKLATKDVHEISNLPLASFSVLPSVPVFGLDVLSKKLEDTFPPDRDAFEFEYSFNSKLGADAHVPFPEGTCGYLYYHCPQGTPLVAGELRFRVLPPSEEGASARKLWEQGKDLLAPTGVPWTMHLLHLHATNHPLLRILVRDKLVSQSLLSVMTVEADTEEKNIWTKARSGTIVHSLGQLFPIQFDKMRQGHFLLSGLQSSHEQPIARGQTLSVPKPIYLDLPGLFSKRVNVPHKLSNRMTYKDVLAFKGQCLCAFEVSDSPEHQETPVIVLRIHKIISCEPQTPSDRSYPKVLLPPLSANKTAMPFPVKGRNGKIRKSLPLTPAQERESRGPKKLAEVELEQKVVAKPQEGELIRWTAEKHYDTGPRAWYVEGEDEIAVALRGLLREPAFER